MARISVLLVLALLGCSSGNQTATNPTTNPTPTPAPAARTGVLTYSTPTDEIHAFDLAANADKKLTDGTQAERAPAGDLVFIDDVDVGPPAKLSHASADGTGKRAIITPGSSTAYYNPVVSPDGTKIAMTYYPRGFAHTLAPDDGTVVLDMTGGVLANLAGVFDPSWLADGRLVLAGTVHTPSGNANAEPTDTPKAAGLFISSADFATVAAIPIAGAASPQTPDASPDGKRVAFMDADHVFVVDLDGANLHALTAGDFKESYPAFSPDGASVAVQSYGSYGGPKPYVALAVVSSDRTTPLVIASDSPEVLRDASAAASSSAGRISAIQHMRWR
jgi:WD40-like Beta Propeller Repeat